MSSLISIAIHQSQFPETVRRELIESLRARRIHHKFHYDSIRQAQKWLELHEACSPARTDADGARIYEEAFMATAGEIRAERVQVIGLGCGGGQKDARLLQLLQARGRKPAYTPCDVSAAMVLVASRAAAKVLNADNCHPLVCDLATTEDLPQVLEAMIGSAGARIITFFGMIPNFEPGQVLPKLTAVVREEDFLLFSANLAPDPDYAAGVQKILPLYDNELTREWLLMLLLDLGIERADGSVFFAVEDCPGKPALKRVIAEFVFENRRSIRIDAEQLEFLPGERLRLFFSYRYTPELVAAVLKSHRFVVRNQWIMASGEEGVFLCQPKQGRRPDGAASRPCHR